MRPRTIFSSRKGFYLVSPFLGFFFFLVAMSVTLTIVTENNQRIDTAKAGATSNILFTSNAMQVDTFDVYFQNYLQAMLDRHELNNSPAVKTYLWNESLNALESDLNRTYYEVYRKAFDISCTVDSTMYSGVFLSFNLDSRHDIIGSGRIFGQDPITKKLVTAAWPYISRYQLVCTLQEPPITSAIDLNGRWYYLNATCICCQKLAADACGGGDLDDFIDDACPYCKP